MQKQPHWKNRFNNIIQVCQDELKRTTEIGKKMLSASKTNSSLHESYEELGHIVAKAIESKELDWDNARAKELIEKINSCKSDLELIEDEVNKIKFASGPVDVSSTDDKSKKKTTKSTSKK